MTTLAELDEIIRQTPQCSFATMDGDQPRLRIFWVWYVDENGIYFHTPKNGNTYQQMLKNPKVELCFFEPNHENRMTRVTGQVTMINNDKAMLEKLLNDRPFLKDLQQAEVAPEELYGMFMLKKQEITIR